MTLDRSRAAGFDRASLTTLVPTDAPAVEALRLDPSCALVSNVFELEATAAESRYRCVQMSCRADGVSAVVSARE